MHKQNKKQILRSQLTFPNNNSKRSLRLVRTKIQQIWNRWVKITHLTFFFSQPMNCLTSDFLVSTNWLLSFSKDSEKELCRQKKFFNKRLSKFFVSSKSWILRVFQILLMACVLKHNYFLLLKFSNFKLIPLILPQHQTWKWSFCHHSMMISVGFSF